MQLFFLKRYPTDYKLNYIKLHFQKLPILKQIAHKVPGDFVRLNRHLHKIKSSLNYEFNLHNKEVCLTTKQNNKTMHAYAREASSDLLAYRQIFIRQDYKRLIEILTKYSIQPHVVFDCGTNVGYTSLFLNQYFDGIKFLCVEPDAGNHKQVEKNFKLNGIKDYKLYQNALWSKKSTLFLNTDFRDGRDWAFNISEEGTGTKVEAVSISDIIKENDISAIDILKIDIEGSEKDVFENDADHCNWLNFTKVIAIEIHDEFQCRPHIYNVLKQYNFELLEDGELTYGINKNLLK